MIATDIRVAAKVLVSGWFSFPQMGATAGDLMARDVACEWLAAAGLAYDVALAAPFGQGVDWRTADPASYSHVLFVCGPFGNGEPITEFLERFRGRTLVGLNLTMLQRLNEWNPFDLLIERDSSEAAHPDLALASQQDKVPVVGVVLVHAQKEYKNGRHRDADAAITRLVESRAMAAVRIDTRLDVNGTGLRTPQEVESLIARMDVVLTTRLHGLVLSIKNGVPPVAVDPVPGGAKVVRQARALGWPIVLTMDQVTDDALRRALDDCLTDDARAVARECRSRAHEYISAMRERFLADLAQTHQSTREQ